MPWIEPVDEFAKPPRTTAAATSAAPWDGAIDADDDEVRLDGVEVAATSITASAQHVELVDCVLGGTTLETDDGGRIDIVNSTLTDCDLSRAKIGTIRGSRLIGCKLSGTDLAERPIRDAAFERCVMRYTNLRRARLERVAITDCQLSECDLFEAVVEDCSFRGSEIHDMAIERTRFERVDLRDVSNLGLSDPTNLRGCLIDDRHVVQLAYPLAFRAGATIERDPDDAGD